MAKRKIDCSLDDYINDFLKKRKYEKTSKFFEEKNAGSKKTNSEIYARFKNYLMAKEIKKEKLMIWKLMIWDSILILEPLNPKLLQ